MLPESDISCKHAVKYQAFEDFHSMKGNNDKLNYQYKRFTSQ